jgi:hypothetical protein
VNPASSTAAGRSTIRVGSGGGAAARASRTTVARAYANALTGRHRGLVHGQAARLDVGAHEGGHVGGGVHLVQRDEPRAVGEAAVLGQLVLDRVDVGQRVAPGVLRGEVHDVHEHLAALDVAQELQAEALPLGRAGDEPGNVRHGEDDVAGRDDAEVRHQGGERVVGDLRLRGAQHRDQARLPRAREADERHVGDRLQLEDDVAGLPGLAQLGEPGRLAPLGRQGGVAAAAAAAARDDQRRAVADEVGQHLAVLGLHDGPVGDGQHEVGGVGAVAVGAHPLAAGAGLLVGVEVVVDQRRDAGLHDEDHVAAVAAVAAVGAAERLELLPVDRRAAGTAVAGGDVQDDAVHEHSFSLLQCERAGPRRTRPALPRSLATPPAPR